MKTVVVCGMPSEKRILSSNLPDVLVLSGTDKLNLPTLVPPDTERLVCAGLCGGLSKKLVVPQIAVATTVVHKSGNAFLCDFDWNERATALFDQAKLDYHTAAWYSSGLLGEADEAPQRAMLAAQYGADVIDDETRYVVAEAERRQIPCNVMRPLSDDWRDNLPLLARGNVLDANGSPNLFYLARALGEDQGPNAESVFTVAEHARQSLVALEAMAKALYPLIAGD